MIPTFAIGTAAEYHAGRRGLGSASGAEGDRPPGAGQPHRAERDPGRLRPDHRQPDGRRPWPDRAAEPDVRPATLPAGAWPCPVIPFAVNVVQYPVPSGRRCFMLGQGDPQCRPRPTTRPLNVQIWGTGGMSHQLQGPRAGLINREWDNRFLDRLIAEPDGAVEVAAHRLRARGRQRGHRARDVADRARRHGRRRRRRKPPTVRHRFYHVPASNTAVGHLILETDVARRLTRRSRWRWPAPAPSASSIWTASGTSTASR